MVSKITVKKIEPVVIHIPEFICDHPISKKELPIPFNYLNKSNLTLFIAPPGAGKTSLLISLISQTKPKLFRKCYEKVILVMPSHSRMSLKKDPFKNLKGGIYDDLNEVNIEEIHNKIIENSGNDENTLLILDDQSASLKKNMFIQNELAKLCYNRRHLRLSIYITLQSYITLPLNVRKCVSSIFLFKTSKKEIEVLFNELFEYSKDTVLKIMNICYDKPHNWIMLNIESQSIFTNDFKQIIVEDAESAEPSEIEI
jgi:GTPase SAR1 family protein